MHSITNLRTIIDNSVKDNNYYIDSGDDKVVIYYKSGIDVLILYIDKVDYNKDLAMCSDILNNDSEYDLCKITTNSHIYLRIDNPEGWNTIMTDIYYGEPISVDSENSRTYSKVTSTNIDDNILFNYDLYINCLLDRYHYQINNNLDYKSKLVYDTDIIEALLTKELLLDDNSSLSRKLKLISVVRTSSQSIRYINHHLAHDSEELDVSELIFLDMMESTGCIELLRHIYDDEQIEVLKRCLRKYRDSRDIEEE